MKVREQKAFLIDLRTGERLEFQFNPNDITDEKTAAYASIQIPGLSHPRYQFVSGGPRRIRFQINLFKGPVKDQVTWLQSLCYPTHEKTILRAAPSKVMLVYGDLYPNFIAVVKEVKAHYFSLFDYSDLLPQHAVIEITLEESVFMTDPPGYK